MPAAQPHSNVEVDAKVVIKNDSFEPAHLKIEKGQIVEWVVGSSLEENQSSLYCFSGRSHVISFDNLNAESDLLSKNTDSFKVRFLETGTYNYRCQIYTRMRGIVEVFDVKPKIPVVKNLKELGFLINQAAIP